MRGSLDLVPAVEAAFSRIVDYAGLFPPAQLPIGEAAAEYERERLGRHAWMLGRFVVPVARIVELDSLLSGSATVPAAVLLNGGTLLSRTAHVVPERCEVVLRVDREAGAARAAVRALKKSVEALAPALPVVVEIPSGISSAMLAESVDALAEEGFTAKIRCGGVTADAAPAVETVSAFIAAAVHAGVPFKATAGLHHPVRHFNEAAGFMMHGFLNVLAAACFCGDVDSATLARIVGEEDAQSFRFDENGFAWRGCIAREERLRGVRERVFLSFGSCSFGEPVGDLVALGILPPR
jgi:hypothetical protein